MISIVSIVSLELLESDEAKCFMNYEIQLTSDGEDLNTECKGFFVTRSCVSYQPRYGI